MCRVATLLPAYQSSVWESHEASYAVDSYQHATELIAGNKCSVTEMETNPWWAVDLGTLLTVTGVYFTNVDHRRKYTIIEELDMGRVNTRVGSGRVQLRGSVWATQDDITLL